MNNYYSRLPFQNDYYRRLQLQIEQQQKRVYECQNLLIEAIHKAELVRNMDDEHPCLNDIADELDFNLRRAANLLRITGNHVDSIYEEMRHTITQTKAESNQKDKLTKTNKPLC